MDTLQCRKYYFGSKTSENAKVHFEYYEIDNPQLDLKLMKKLQKRKQLFVAKLIADQVMPGKKYNYEIFINDIKVFRDYEMEFQTQQL